MTAADAISIADTGHRLAPPHEVSAAVRELHEQIREAAGAGRRSLTTPRPAGVSPGVLREALRLLIQNNFIVNNRTENGRELVTVNW